MESYLIQCNNGEIDIEHSMTDRTVTIWIGSEDIDLNAKETKRLIDVLQKKLDLIRE